MKKPIEKIITKVEGVMIRGKSMPKGSIISVLQEGQYLEENQINEGVAKYLILNKRAGIADQPVESKKNSSIKGSEASSN